MPCQPSTLLPPNPAARAAALRLPTVHVIGWHGWLEGRLKSPRRRYSGLVSISNAVYFLLLLLLPRLLNRNFDAAIIKALSRARRLP